MVYLDYSATTPVDKDVLDTFYEINTSFVGNANSLHNLGLNANKLINSSTEQIKKLLNVDNVSVIYTSSSSESNNLAIKGIANAYKSRGKKIITSPFEHSSVNEVMKYLNSIGYEICYLEYDKDGLIDLTYLDNLIDEDTILVSINAIDSELGIRQDIESIANIVKKHQKCFLHVDMTQAIGKININLQNIDLFTFSAHKIYGLKGIGCLIKKDGINLIPLIHGGKSTTIYRSGTPAHPLIASLSKALRLATNDLDNKYNYVLDLNKYLKEKLAEYKMVSINSNDKCIPHILNISIIGVNAETILHALEEDEIYVSTKSACSDQNSMSDVVYNLYRDEKKAKSSIRISLSHLTTKEELDIFLNTFKRIYNRLVIK